MMGFVSEQSKTRRRTKSRYPDLPLRRFGGCGRNYSWRGNRRRGGIDAVCGCGSRGDTRRCAGVWFFDRLRSVDASCTGAQSKFLQRGRVKLAARIQAVGGLKLLHCGNGIGIPLAVGLAFEIAAARQRCLNFGDAVCRRSLLEWLAPRAAAVAWFFLFAGGGRFMRRDRCGRSGGGV